MLKEEYLRSQSRPSGPIRNYGHAWTVDPQDEGAKFCRGRACPARSGRSKRRPYLPSFPRRRESRLDPGSESGVTASDWIPSTQLTLTKIRDRTYESEH